MGKMDDLVTKFPMKMGNSWGTGVILINSDGLFLVGKRTDNNLFGTPGGTVKLGETPLECVKRECFEESKIQLKDSQLQYIDSFLSPSPEKVWVSFCFIAKNVKVDESQVKAQPSEIVEWKWLKLQDVLKLKLFPPTQQSLELAIKRGFI